MIMSEFMARVVPTTGNYVSVCWMGPPKVDGKRVPIHRFFPIAPNGDGFNQAQGLLHWAVRKGTDAYFALAAYTLATQEDGQLGPVWKGNRKVENVQTIKVLVIDADVSRPGDGKKPGDVFPDRATCLQWVAGFAQKTGLKRPTLIVNSGYGFHFYWCLDTPLTVAQWKPVALAFLAAMQAHGWTGDTQATVDAARILRPPGTVNIKAGMAAPVSVVGTVLPDDYKLSDVMVLLGPYMAQAQVTAGVRRVGGSAQTPIKLAIGPRPGHIPEDLGDNQNAGAGAGPEPDGFPERTYRFANIWPKCEQLKRSVNEHGEHDSRDIWRLDNMPTLGFCVDGSDWVHPISDGHKTYKPEDTDAQFAQTLEMIQNKNLGPTKCTTFARHRPGVCDTCAFFGKVTTPLQLGEDAVALPRGWQVEDEVLQRWNPKEKDWDFVAQGAFSEPECRQLPSRAHELTFTYTLGGKHVRAAVSDLDCSNAQGLQTHLALAGISYTPDVAGKVGVFLVAWINKLKEANAVVHGATARPFGWNIVDGKCVGFAVAGTLYRSDGTVQQLMVPDGTLASAYTPAGDPDLWRRAAKHFEGTANRPDLQVAVGASFGAPLMGLTSDVAGMTINMWSPASSVGKTTVLRFSQAIWGKRSRINSKSDTVMSFFNSLGSVRVMPCWWDEYQGDKDELTKLVYDIPQGRERNRLTSTIRQREGGEWETILVMGSNRAHSNTLILDHTHTDAAVLRILDIPLPKLPMSADGTVSRLVNELKDNYGHIGRIYAAYLGSNHEAIKTMLVQAHDALAKVIDRGEERFYLAVCTAILVGSIIARQIGLFDFDIQGVKKVLIDAVLATRHTRAGGQFILPSGMYDLASVTSGFINENAPRYIRTNTVGGKSIKGVMIEMPHPRDGVIVQVATSGTIRIDRAAFNRWMESKKLPSSQILSQMRDVWRVKEARVALGAGTNYTTGQTWCVDIDKATANDPNLDPLFDTGRDALL